MLPNQPTPDPSRNIVQWAFIAVLVLLFFHFYYFCHLAFTEWRLSWPILDRLAANLRPQAILHHRFASKLVILLGILATLCFSSRSRQPSRKMNPLAPLTVGAALYFGSDVILHATGDPKTIALAYMACTSTGLALLYFGVRPLIDGILRPGASAIFNRENETFPQQERRVAGAYSLHFKARYQLGNQTRDSQINLVDRFRGTLIVGGPGSGKTSHLIRPIIRQSLAQGMALCVYDLKFDSLTRLTYNVYLKERDRYPVEPKFYCLNFQHLRCSHRCNPLDPAGIRDAADARNIARTVLVALNPDWARKSGDFFIESAIGFIAAALWFLRRYEDGRYCTLPHLIEFIQADYAHLFSVLQSDPQVQSMIKPFVSALQNKTFRQLQGQLDSARVPLLALASPNIYYLTTGADFTLDLNNPRAPKIICFGSDPGRQDVYGPVITLYLSRLLQVVNRNDSWPCEICLDEFSSLPPVDLHTTLAQARENKVSVTFGIQDLSQLRSIYGRDRADSLFNLPGNIFCGQIGGDAADLVSRRIGLIQQPRSSTSTNSKDQSTTESTQLGAAVPASRIATFSSGEFTGITADNPLQPLDLKVFHARIHADFAAMQADELTWRPLPEVHPVTSETIDAYQLQIKAEAAAIVKNRLAEMKTNPHLVSLIIKKRINPADPHHAWKPKPRRP